MKARLPQGYGKAPANNMNSMIKQAQKMQEELAKKQAELDEMEFSTTAGGGVVTVVMNGGIFHAYPHYAEAVRKKASPRANMILADVPAIYGAFVEALWQGNVRADEETRRQFMADYERIIT